MGTARTVLRRGLEVLGGATVAASALPLVAKLWWVLDLVTHFRLQLVATQLVLLTALVLARRFAWASILAAVLAANVYDARAYLWPGPPFAGPAHELRVMTANVQAENTRADGLLDHIAREEPDVLAILEFNRSWATRLASLGKTYPYRIEVPRLDRFGIALLARQPFLESRVVDLQGYPAIVARIDAGTTTAQILAAHAVPPMSAALTALRQRQLAELAELAAGATEPLVVLADLNLSPFSPYFAEFLGRARLHDALVGHGPQITWPTFFPALGIPIDHCLLSPAWRSIAYRRQPAYGSDHFAVVVDLIMETPR